MKKYEKEDFKIITTMEAMNREEYYLNGLENNYTYMAWEK